MSPFQLFTKLKKVQLGERSRGQGMLEFAIALPILLLLIFGLIEFARVFQAWLAVTNAAKFGMRYAITGEYDGARCVDLDGDGKSCGSESDRAVKNREEDGARMSSIKDVVRGVMIGPSLDDTAVKGAPGYYKITVCSSRAGHTYNPPPQDECTPFEDPGNPEEGANRVLVAVTYEHPIILPFISSIVPSLTLHSERSGLLEQFRVARVLGLPPVIDVPTATLGPGTPSPTPTPTDTPSPTPPPTDTPTPLPTDTPTPTPQPSCDDLVVNSYEPIYFSGESVEMSLYNQSSFYPILLTGVTTLWNGLWHDQVDPLPANQAFDRYLWNANEVLNPDNVPLPAGGASFSHVPQVTVDPYQTGLLGIDFTYSFSSYYVYFHANDFNVTLAYQVGGLSCSKDLTGRKGPVVEAVMPPDPITGAFSIEALAEDPDPDGSIARVKFTVYEMTDPPVNVGNAEEKIAGYCLFGGDSPCGSRTPGETWPGSSKVIKNGSFWVEMQAKDNDAHPQFTRIKAPFTIYAPTPTPVTPTATAKATKTPAPTPTQRKPKNTNTPTPTPNAPMMTNTPKPPPATKTPSPPTHTPGTSTPTATQKASPTPTRTPCPGGGFDC